MPLTYIERFPSIDGFVGPDDPIRQKVIEELMETDGIEIYDYNYDFNLDVFTWALGLHNSPHNMFWSILDDDSDFGIECAVVLYITPNEYVKKMERLINKYSKENK